MDDPLSAVDAHVGRHIMDNAICGLLKGKARILVTHQLHVLNRCDRIIWMDGGRIKTIDTFDNMMANNVEFQKLMESTTVEEEKGKDKEETDEVEEEKKDANARGKKKAKALMTAEERATDSVDWGVYKAYLRAAGGLWVAPIVLTFLLMAQVSNISTSLWLSFWTSNKFHYSTGKYVSHALPSNASNGHRLGSTRRLAVHSRFPCSASHCPCPCSEPRRLSTCSGMPCVAFCARPCPSSIPLRSDASPTASRETLTPWTTT
jgi:hypothetical protein